MDFELSEEQKTIYQMARDFASDRFEPFALEWEAAETFPVETLREAAGLGMGGIYVSEDINGSGLGRMEAALVFEGLARGCPSTAAYLSIHNMCAWMVDKFGSSDLRQNWGPGLCSMEFLTSYCLTEPGSGSDAAALTTTAKVDGGNLRLNGTKAFISGASVSDLYLVMARTGEMGPNGISCILVPKDTRGLSFGKLEKKMGWNTQPTALVQFDDVIVPTSNVVGKSGEGFKIAMQGLDGGRLNISACSLGAAQRALEKSLDYMRERTAFGQRLEEFQALQFRLADMETDLQAARIFLWKAAWELDQGSREARKYCAMVKRFVTDAGFKVANEALQLHGGYGYLRDFGLEKIVRDLRVHQILEGTNEIMRLIVARSLINSPQ
ncbi:MAG: acyl-CoA dehydrogenase family protein [Desulfobulbia bacterium]